MSSWIPKRSPKRADPVLYRLLREAAECFYCGCALDETTGTLDHYIPRSRGGRGAANFRLACFGCNNEKGDLMPDEYVSRRAKGEMPNTPREVRGARGEPVSTKYRDCHAYERIQIHLACPDGRDRSAEFKAMVDALAGPS